MPKIMSILEKLNVIEKVDSSDIEEEMVNDNQDEFDEQNNIKQSIEILDHEDEEEIIVEQSKLTIEKDENKFDYNKVLEVNKVYELYNIKNDDMNSVYLLENFINAIPQDLPHAVKKQTVLNILAASKLVLNEFIREGQERTSVLNKFSSDYNKNVSNEIENYRKEIDKLKNAILLYEAQIDVKQKMIKEQVFKTNYEIQRINNVIKFFEEE